MPTPQGLRTVTLRGRYVEPDLLGTPLKGSLTFAPNVTMVMFPVENTLMSGVESVTLDNNGEFVIELVVTDTPGQNPTNWTYTVTEKLIGVRGRTYNIVLNYTEEVVELSDIIPTQQAPTYLPVYGPQGPPGVIQSINGYSQAYVELTAMDVLAVPSTGPSTITGVKTFTSSPQVPVPASEGGAAPKSYVDAEVSTRVTLATPQNITGLKTFTQVPVLPEADPTSVNQATRKGYVDAGLALKANSADVTSQLALKANSSDVTSSLALKANTSDVDSGLALKADSATVTSALALKADDTSVVKLTGAQTVGGLKTFSTIPSLPASNPTTDNQPARKAYVDAGDNAAVKLTGAQSVEGLKTFVDGFISGGLGQIQCPVKSGDTSRVSTISPANDPHLTAPVAANAKYVLEVVAVWSNGGGGFRCSFVGPSGATMVWTDNDGAGIQAIGTDSTFMVTSGTTFQGVLQTAGTAGTVAFRWAQSQSNAGATVLKGGCYMKVTRVA